MSGDPTTPVPTANRVGSALVVTLPAELGDAAFALLRGATLERLRSARLRAIIFEASGLEFIDRREFEALSAIARSARWLGARALLVGLRPGIVAYLVGAGVDTGAFEPYATLDDALAVQGVASAESGRGVNGGGA
jgi:rsbT co-antagonist protein RsbR